MSFLHLTFFYALLTFLLVDPAVEYSPTSPTKTFESIAADPTAPNDVKPGATNIIFQSKDGGETWQDISHGLPENDQPEGFFAGESDLYLRVKNVIYRSKSNLESPVWEKEKALDPRCSSIAFTRSGATAYNYDGDIYQEVAFTRTWLPIHKNFKKQSMRTIFETLDGTIFLGSDHGLYKSIDDGKSWRQVQNEGWVMEMVESDGVLVATGQNGIMRSTDNGEHWEWVIREGGVGIAIERINGGFAAISCNSSTISRRMRVSFDTGKTWQAIDEGLEPSLHVSSVKQMGGYLLCGRPEGIFRSSDMGKTWQIVHPAVDQRVFKLYVSGNVVYAVARGLGC